MKNGFDQYIEDKTSLNLHRENRRLKLEIEKLKKDFLNARKLLDFHDQLEKDFFSADGVDVLIVKLINRLQLRPEIDFVSLCLTKQYLEGMLVSHEFDNIFPEIGYPAKLRCLSIVDEESLFNYIGKTPHIQFEKTPMGSRDIFFPDHGDEVRSQAIIPLLLGTQIIGSLNLGSILGRHYYSTDMGSDLLMRLASKLAIAIDRIISHKKLSVQNDMLDKDIHQAALLQKSLLAPSLFEEGPLKISTYFRPCHLLGGDFYDFIRVSPHRVAIIIADASGHGISAAIISAMLKLSLKTMAFEKLSPEKVVSHINQQFCQIFKHGDYITLCYSIIDLENSVLNLVRAGHPYPLLFRHPHQDLIELKPDGPPIGLHDDASFQNMEIGLQAKDVLFFYTDGLLGAVPDSNQKEMLQEMILKMGLHWAASRDPGKLASEIDHHIPFKTRDDTSLIIASMR